MDLCARIVNKTHVIVLIGDQHVGALDVPPDVAIEAADRIGDNTPAAIRDRCYSLVQSIAKYDYPEIPGPADAWIDEAYAIAKDAGWVK